MIKGSTSLNFDEHYLVRAFAERHGITIREARRAISELGVARAEATAVGGVLGSYLAGRLSPKDLKDGSQ
jgi:hypothetical protein